MNEEESERKIMVNYRKLQDKEETIKIRGE